MKRAPILLLLCGLSAPALAQTPMCSGELAQASRLVEEVAARDRQGPIADTAKLCQTLRANRSAMTRAAYIMNKCLSGHARGENVGQLLASVEDIDGIIRQKCR